MRRSTRCRLLVWRRLALVAGSVSGAIALAASSPSPAGATPVRQEITSATSEVDAVGGTAATVGASSTLSDTTWIADWSFDGPSGTCLSAGWTTYDAYIQNDGSNYWVVDNRFAGTCGISKAAVLTRHDLCWARDGYGNDWDFSIVLKYRAPATLQFDTMYDSEAGYDFVTVETDSLGLSATRLSLCANPKGKAADYRLTLASFDGISGGCQHIGPMTLTNFGPGTHEAYIRFASDAGFSDEDGEYPTAIHAAVVVDNIVMTGPLSYSENFEAALNPNVQLLNTSNAQHFCGAPWWRLFQHLTDNDKCTEDMTCAWIDTDPLRIAFDPSMTWGPSQAVIHNWLDDILVSPWVSLASSPSTASTLLSFRRFGGNLVARGDIVQGWRVRTRLRVPNTDTPAPGDSIYCTTAWGHAFQFNSLDSFQWLTIVNDITPFFNPAGRDVQVSFRNTDFQLLSGVPPPATLNPGPGPYIDRVRIGRRVLTGPAINEGVDSRTQAQDAFPTVQNALGGGQHFSPDGSNRFGTCAFSAGGDLGINGCCSSLISADSITLEQVVDARNAGGVASVRFYGAIRSGPHAGKAPIPYAVGANGFFQVNADSARGPAGIVVANRWFVDLDDTYFRGGDVLQYFWAATDNGGGFTSDPAGLTALPASVSAAEIATQGLFEVNFLPTLNWSATYLARLAADAHGDLDPTPAEVAASAQKNCVLYVQKSNSRRRSGAINRTSFMYTMLFQIDMDVYDVQGYGNTNNALGSRANVGQCSGYSLIIQDDGRSALTPNMPDGSNTDSQKINQAQWYRDYLAQGVSGIAGTATLWILGENTAFEKAANPLFAADMGLAGVVNDQGLGVNPDVQGAGSFTWAGGNVTNFASDQFSLNGGCPAVRAYDGASAGGTAVVTHQYGSGPTTGLGAVIMNKNSVFKWNTVWMGFGWADIQDALGSPPGRPDALLATKILGGSLPAQCFQSGPGATDNGQDPETAVPRVTELHQNVPNPFNPTTRITFDLAKAGHVKLQVFDVAGRLVRTLVDATLPARRGHEAVWNGLDESAHRATSGVYFYRLTTAELTLTRKLALLK
jgi:hypothetical protein